MAHQTWHTKHGTDDHQRANRHTASEPRNGDLAGQPAMLIELEEWQKRPHPCFRRSPRHRITPRQPLSYTLHATQQAQHSIGEQLAGGVVMFSKFAEMASREASARRTAKYSSKA
ncbi:MAG: hypothetical protein ABI068_07180 [Ktedonobacterales bacterium]